MPYVIRRDNDPANKYKFSYFTGNSFPQQANRFDCTVRVPVFPSKKAAIDWCAEHKLKFCWLELELKGWELVQVRNRKVEGLMVHAINYNNKVRAISGTSAMMAQVYRSLGFFQKATNIESECLAIRELLADQYAETKRQLEEGMKDAKSR